MAWRSDFGLSQLIEPEAMEMLAEAILVRGQLGTKHWHQSFSVHCVDCSLFGPLRFKVVRRFRFCTNADVPGVERISIVKPDKSYLETTYRAQPELIPGRMLLWFLITSCKLTLGFGNNNGNPNGKWFPFCVNVSWDRRRHYAVRSGVCEGVAPVRHRTHSRGGSEEVADWFRIADRRLQSAMMYKMMAFLWMNLIEFWSWVICLELYILFLGSFFWSARIRVLNRDSLIRYRWRRCMATSWNFRIWRPKSIAAAESASHMGRSGGPLIVSTSVVR